MTEETWKVIPGWENYKASSLGRIQGPRCILKPYKTPYGYLTVNLCKPNTPDTRFMLHRLICIVFHGPPPFVGAMALHRNHIRDDCREKNLKWGTRQENADDMVAAGRQARNMTNTKLDWDKVREIRRLYRANVSRVNLMKQFQVGDTCIHNIVNNKTWKE